MRRGNRHLVGVVLGGRSGGSRDATMRSLLAENLEKAATKRTVAAIAERARGRCQCRGRGRRTQGDRAGPGRRAGFRCGGAQPRGHADQPIRHARKTLADGGRGRRLATLAAQA